MSGSAPSPRERMVNTPNGRVFVSEMPGQDPPIVLMHGFPDDHRIYDGLTAPTEPEAGCRLRLARIRPI
jgi:pimeloyl-ACP methyl ester carboxylesterase